MRNRNKSTTRSENSSQLSDPYYLPLDKIKPKDHVKQLGKGSFGVVYLTKYEDKEIAVKEISILDDDQIDQSSGIHKELTALKSISEKKASHPEMAKNVVEYFGFSVDPATYYMAFEYINYGSLTRWVSSYPKASFGSQPFWKEAYSFTNDIANGLLFLHDIVDYLHCDIKPDNILIEKLPNGQLVAKLTDFGLSRQKDYFKLVNFNLRAVGTPVYMAPELISYKSLNTEKSDMFSFGLLVWFMSSNTLPAANISTWTELKLRRADRDERENIPVNCPPKVACLIKWFWQADAAKRPNAKEALSEMESGMDVISDKLTQFKV